MAAKIEVHKIMQFADDLETLRKIYQRFKELKTETAEDHHLFREFERIFRSLERLLNTFKNADLSIRG